MNNILPWIKRQNPSLFIWFVVFWTPVIIFLKIAGEVLERQPIKIDIVILQWLHAHSSPFLDRFLFVITEIGGPLGMTIITAVIAGIFVYRHRYERAVLLAASVAGATIANIILKALFHRPRPSLFTTEIVEKSFSFPSGHAMASMAITLCFILMYWQTKWRWAVAVAGVLVVAVVGVSRPYFGVHYPSDIVAGWCASAGWVLLVFYVVRVIRKRRESAKITDPS